MLGFKIRRVLIHTAALKPLFACFKKIAKELTFLILFFVLTLV
ncbi:hypothetical protein NY10_1072 [Carnobacterium antarcticum]|nr:hypothetical protein NY10_1072 [Carnobacterium sp. CP1]